MKQSNSELNWDALMVQVQAGNEDAYNILLEGLYQMLKRYLMPKIGRMWDVEDVIQDVCLAVHRVRHTYDPTKPFIPWVLAITKYKLIHYFKSFNKNQTGNCSIDAVSEGVASATHLDQIDTKIDLNTLLQALTPAQRDLLTSVKLEGLSGKEAAEKFNMSVSNVKTSVHRAIARLKGIVS